MTARIALVFSALAIVFSAGIAGATDYGYVPYGPYNTVSLAPTFAGAIGLKITTPQWSYGAFQTYDYQGHPGTSINNDGQVWVHPSHQNGSPRLILSSSGYDGQGYNDTMQELIGSSPVFALSPGGEVESYNYYVNGDSPRISVRNQDDSLAGGIDGAGRFTTLAHAGPNPADMANGEARVWFDSTPSTGGLMVTMKDSAGNVHTVKLG